MRRLFERIINRFRKPVELSWQNYDKRIVTFTETMKNGQRRDHKLTITGNQITLCEIESMLRKRKGVSCVKSTILYTKTETEILQGENSGSVSSAVYHQTLREAAYKKQMEQRLQE